MKKSLLIILFFYCLTNFASGQEQDLRYKFGHFITEEGQKHHWKNADALFSFDQDLQDRYKKFRRTKKNANIIGLTCLAQLAIGTTLLYAFNQNSCSPICIEQFIGLGVLLTIPLTGLAGVVVAAIASGRKSKIVYLYNGKDLSTFDFQEPIQSELRLNIHGLGLGLTYSF